MYNIIVHSYTLCCVTQWVYSVCSQQLYHVSFSLQVSGEFRQLKPVFQEVISDITQRMGSGMCVFLEDRVGSMAQWDEVWWPFSLSKCALCMCECEKEGGIEREVLSSM